MRRTAVFATWLGLLAPAVALAQQSIDRYTRDFEKRDGYFPLYWDQQEGRLLLEVPRLDVEFLYLTSLATGLGSIGLDRGSIGDVYIARFERVGPTILLVLTNPRFRAVEPDNPAIVRAVNESFPTSTVAAFDVLAESDDGRVLVDATSHFLADHVGVTDRLRGSGTFALDRRRSSVYHPRTKSFPTNTEVEVSLTFTSPNPGPLVRQHAPDGRAITLRQHHSLAELPDEGYTPRHGDPHIGLFGVSFFDFSKPFDRAYRTRYIARHRLQKRNPRDPVSEPIEPIVYYLDQAIPAPYRRAFREGAMWWNAVFEAAGFRDAFRVEDMPDDMDPMDARYHVIQWVHRSHPGSSIGPTLVDPRTGEIIKAAVRMDSYRSLTDYNIYAGLLPPGDAVVDHELGDWIARLDPNVNAEAFVMARRRQHAAHEVGHTLGLSHNFVAASYGRASVMDYPAPLIRLDGDQLDLSEAYRNGPGAYDSLAIRFAYTEFAPGDKERGLRAIVDEATQRGVEFNIDSWSWSSYPEVTQWVNGDDAVTELERVMTVRRTLIARFDERAIADGEPMVWLNRRFVPVYLHHRYALEAATKAVGGMEFRYAVRGDSLPPTTLVPPERQRRALELVLDALEPDNLVVPERVLALMAPRAYGYSTDQWFFATKTAPAFDQVGAARSLATTVLGNLLAPQRTARLVAFHARNPDLPPLEEVVGRVVERTWSAAPNGPHPVLRRVVQRAVVDELINLAANGDASVEARAAAEWGLRRIDDLIQSTPTRLPAEQAHQTLASADIQRFLTRRAEPTERSEPLRLPPGSPIGGR